jgi:hypothetical protein
MLASSVVHLRFEPMSDQTKDNKIGICCFSAKHAALRRKNKDWLTQNQDNVSEWSDMFFCGLLFIKHNLSSDKKQFLRLENKFGHQI